MTPQRSRDARDSAEPVKLLWTGGWDSTYRLLDLVLVQARTVQPVYFALERRSAPMERRAMESIREGLAERWPLAAHLVLPTRYHAMEPVPEDPEALAALQALRGLPGARRLGGQYYSLAAAARHYRIDDLELGLHAEEGSAWYDRLNANVVADGDTWRLVADPEPDALRLLEPFSFPLLTLTKRDMAARAKSAGFAELLERTWFCHTPDARGRPCGLCAPCRLTMKQGLARRVPRLKRLRHHLAWPIIVALHRLGARRRPRAAWNRARSVLEGRR
jgi:hypothetical protein